MIESLLEHISFIIKEAWLNTGIKIKNKLKNTNTLFINNLAVYLYLIVDYASLYKLIYTYGSFNNLFYKALHYSFEINYLFQPGFDFLENCFNSIITFIIGRGEVQVRRRGRLQSRPGSVVGSCFIFYDITACT